jgi:hypothetical protein
VRVFDGQVATCSRSLIDVLEKMISMHPTNLQVCVFSKQAIKILKDLDIPDKRHAELMCYIRNFNEYLLTIQRTFNELIYFKADIMRSSIEHRSQILDNATDTLKTVLFFSNENQKGHVHGEPYVSMRKKIYQMTYLAMK